MQITSADKPSASGSIIATASVAGLRANAGPVAYSAAKSTVVSLAQTLSFQLYGSGVRINAICPGLIETGMTDHVFKAVPSREESIGAKLARFNPLDRAGHPDEIARVTLFLGSDDSSYVNGQAWAVDGGLSAGHAFLPSRVGQK